MLSHVGICQDVGVELRSLLSETENVLLVNLPDVARHEVIYSKVPCTFVAPGVYTYILQRFERLWARAFSRNSFT